MADLTPAQQSGVILYTTAGFFPGILSFTLPKLAVISLLCRMLNPSRNHKIFLWSMGALLLANAITCFAVLMGRCIPFQAVYDVTFPAAKARCFDKWINVAIAIYTTVCCAVVDLYLAVYPAIVLSKLQINIKKKIALSVALGIGSMWVLISTPLPLACVCKVMGDIAHFTNNTTERIAQDPRVNMPTVYWHGDAELSYSAIVAEG